MDEDSMDETRLLYELRPDRPNLNVSENRFGAAARWLPRPRSWESLKNRHKDFSKIGLFVDLEFEEWFMSKKGLSLIFVGITVALGACSSSPDKISAQYVSPLMYQSYDCDQISMELRRVNRRLLEVTGAQQKEADKDAVAMGVGLVLFWPALFLLAGEDHAAELGRLKGEYEALESAAIRKRCDIAAELEAAKRERERREKEAKEKLEKEPIVN